MVTYWLQFDDKRALSSGIGKLSAILMIIALSVLIMFYVEYGEPFFVIAC
jgi:hypothetical protein